MEIYQEINPWKHIWTRPRQTMAYLLQSDYSGWKWIIPLAWLAGIYKERAGKPSPLGLG